MPTRREFLEAASLSAAVGLGSRALRAASVPPPGTFIDAHAHVWTDDVDRYPLAAGFKPADMQPASFPPEELLEHAESVGVGRVVLIQMSYYGTDNAYMLDCIAARPRTFVGVAVVDHHAANLAETAAALKGRGVRGFRIAPGKQAPEAWLGDDDMRSLWQIGASQNLKICALVNPSALEPLDAMCARHPETPLVIDHCARVGMDGEIRAADLERLCRLARHRHTRVKVSAFYALSHARPKYLDLAPMIRRLLDAFGPQRLMWASDSPFQVVDGHTYRDSIELIQSRLDFLTDAAKQALLWTTAEATFFT